MFKRYLFRVTVISLTLISVRTCPARCDTIYLNNGRKIEGTIIEETDDNITLDITWGSVIYKKDDIVKIKRVKKKKTQPRSYAGRKDMTLLEYAKFFWEQFNPVSILGKQYYKLAKKHMAAGKYNGAIFHLTRALACGFENADVHNLLGRLYLKREVPLKAKEHLKRSIQLYRDEIQMHMALNEKERVKIKSEEIKETIKLLNDK